MHLKESDRIAFLEPRCGRLKAVIDSDAFNEIDDQFAIVHALLSPERLDVQAIYAAPFVNGTCGDPGRGMELSYQEILELLGRMALPHDGFVHRGVSGFVGAQKAPLRAAAVDDLIARARQSTPQDPLYVVAIAAISNIASALLAAPDIADRIVVIWLGGHAIDWPHQAEFNLEQDIGGTQVLFDCGVPLVLVPCEGVTSILHSTVPEIERYVEPCGEIGRFLAMRFKGYTDDHLGWGKEIWDMGPVGWALDAEWAPSVLMPAPVLTSELRYGRDLSRHLMRYVFTVNRNAIMRDFIRKLRAFSEADLGRSAA